MSVMVTVQNFDFLVLESCVVKCFACHFTFCCRTEPVSVQRYCHLIKMFCLFIDVVSQCTSHVVYFPPDLIIKYTQRLSL